MATLLYGLAEAALWSSLIIVFVFVIRKPVVRYFGAKWSYALWLLPALKMMILVTPQTQLSLLPSWQTIIYNFNMQQGVYALLQNGKPLTASEALFKQINAENTARLEAMKTAMREGGSTFPAERISERNIPLKISPSSAPVGGWPVFSEIDGVTIIFFVWLGGFVMMGLVTILRHVRLYEQLLKEKREPSPEMRALLAQLCLKMGLKFQGDVFVSARIQGPAVIGWLHPKLVLPLRFVEFYSQRETEFILAHELAHLQRKDFLFTAWALALKCIYWFNPLIYLAYPLFRLDQELACDQLVLTSVAPQERKSYGLTILKTLSQPEMMLERFQVGCFWFTFSQMKERIVMINHHRNSKGRSMLALISMIVLGFTALTFAASDMVKDPSTGKMVTAPEYGGTFTFANPLELPHADSAHSGGAGVAVSGVVEKLAIMNWALDRDEFAIRSTYTPEFTFRGHLAESWEQPDPKTYIFHIRPGVHWHDKAPMNGRELTADDIEYTYHRHMGLGDFTEATSPGPSPKDLPWESITATDKYTVVMKLKEPPPAGALSLILGIWSHTFIYPPEVIKEHGDVKDWRNLVGTGPYEMTDWVEGSSITYIKNPDYWGHDEKYPQNRLPYFDELQSVIVKEEATYLAGLRAGKIDFIGFTAGVSDIQSVDVIESLRRTNPEIVLQPWWDRSETSYALDASKPPFDDVRVRRAMQMALDLEGINRSYFKSTAMWQPQGMVGEAVSGFSTPFEEWPAEVKKGHMYDPAGAEALLDAAGYPRGADGTRFKTVLNHMWRFPLGYSELAATYWADIGVDVEINVMDEAAAAAVRTERAWEGMLSIVQGSNSDPFYTIRAAASSTVYNYHGIENPELEALIEAAPAATSIEEQQRLVKEADMYTIENHWYVWGPKAGKYMAHQPWVIGFNGETWLGMQDRLLIFARLWVDSALKKEMGH